MSQLFFADGLTPAGIGQTYGLPPVRWRNSADTALDGQALLFQRLAKQLGRAKLFKWRLDKAPNPIADTCQDVPIVFADRSRDPLLFSRCSSGYYLWERSE